MRETHSSAFTPLEKTTKFIRRPLPYKTNSSLIPPLAHTVRKRSSLTGFTFLEITIVILIIGILLATAVPRFISLREESQKAVEDATIAALQSGINSISAIKNE